MRIILELASHSIFIEYEAAIIAWCPLQVKEETGLTTITGMNNEELQFLILKVQGQNNIFINKF